MNPDDLTHSLKKLGARDPEATARSQLQDGILQLACFVFLRQALQMLASESDSAWIEAQFKHANHRPDDPYVPEPDLYVPLPDLAVPGFSLD